MTAVDDRPATAQGLADLLLEWDRRRPRSQQREIGWSEIGGCRRRAGYRLAGVEPTDAGGSIQAILGTAIHAAVQQVLNEVADPDDLVEYEVTFGGVIGHLDRYHADAAEVDDVKTTSQRWLDHIMEHGPSRDHIWQVSGYGAAVLMTGRPVRRVAIEYIARDTGKIWRWSAPFDPQHVRDALDWLDQVRNSELDMLNRDYAPDSAFCEHCPFRSICWEGGVPDRHPRSVLYVDDPDAEKWARQLDEARADAKAAKDRADEARQALDALRPNVSGNSGPIDVGYEKRLVWSVRHPERLDSKLVRAEYRKVGATPPVNVSTTVKLTFAPAEDE